MWTLQKTNHYLGFILSKDITGTRRKTVEIRERESRGQASTCALAFNAGSVLVARRKPGASGLDSITHHNGRRAKSGGFRCKVFSRIKTAAPGEVSGLAEAAASEAEREF